MQTPAGFRLAGGRAELTDFWAAALNPSTFPRLLHTIAASWAASAFLMAGIAAWYVLKGRKSEVALLSLRMGVIAGLIGCAASFATGDRQARQVARTQAAKFAAMEGLYSTAPGAPLILFSLPPTQTGPREGPELTITKMLSFLAFGNFQYPVKGLEDFPRTDWPPVAVTFLSFHNMVVVGNLMALISVVAAVLLAAKKLETRRWALWALLLAIPLPHVAIQLGWLAAEVGRQPWIVYGVMRTSDAVSRVVTAPQVLFSILLFSAIYLLLGTTWLYILCREVSHGPTEPAAREA